MNEWLTLFPILKQYSMFIWLLQSAFGTKTKETLGGFFKVVSFLKILYLNLVIGDNVKLS